MKGMKPVRMRSYSRRPGITAAGLVLALAAAGVLITLAVPLHERARNVAAFKSTLSDIRLWDDAVRAYNSAKGAAPANPKGPILFRKPIVDELAPFMDQFRTLDWWGYNYQIWTGPGNREYGIALTAPEDFLIVSTGKGGVREPWAYDPAHPDAGLFAVEVPEDYEKDLVIWNGRFVRGPRGAR
jgi:hypothetical protein